MSSHLSKLVRKDLHRTIPAIIVYLIFGALALLIMSLRGAGYFYFGSVLLITVLIMLSMHATFQTVVGERKDQTLAFVLSLPISPADYARAKIMANLISFVAPWALLLLACWAVMVWHPDIADGMIPFATVLFGAAATSAVLQLSVAIVTESMDWTVRMMLVCNLSFHGVMFSAGQNGTMKAAMKLNTLDWNSITLTYLSAELGIAVAALALAMWLQGRKKDFL